MLTVKQIEKIRYFRKKAKEIEGFVEMDSFVNEIKAFFGNEFDCNLKVYTHNTVESYTEILNANDAEAISSFLDKKISQDDANATIESILDLIDEGNSCKGVPNKIEPFVLKIYHMYYGEIVFDSEIENMVKKCNSRMRPMMALGDDGMLDGIIGKLKQYCTELLSIKDKNPQNSNIVIQNINQNTNTINASIEVQINEAKKQAEDLGLGDAQFKELMEQLNRIEEISKSNESKGNKWKKAKEILKWVAEQGIQVAGVVVPVLTTMFMK